MAVQNCFQCYRYRMPDARVLSRGKRDLKRSVSLMMYTTCRDISRPFTLSDHYMQ
jgi:hypothetical protein